MTDISRPVRRVPVPGPAPERPKSEIASKAIAAREAQEIAAQQPRGVQNEITERNQRIGSLVDQHQMTMHQPPPAMAIHRSPPANVGNLAKGIASVMSEVGTIGKTGHNKFHGYHYATLQDLLHALTPLMGKHGVCIIQNEVERGIVENRVLVTYEFSVFHTSGEVWPERPRFTGMSLGRDSKGNYDDKAINKCHSGARKYFLLSLFQVPSGDFDDADQGPPQQPVPQPVSQPVPQPAKTIVPGPSSEPLRRKPMEGGPYKLVLGKGSGVDMWASAYIESVSKAESAEEIGHWARLNNDTLQHIHDKYPDTYSLIDVAEQDCLARLGPAAGPPLSNIAAAMPDPSIDTQDSMNWIAQQLSEMRTLEAVEAFWNKIVAPHERNFDDMDWELLLKEFRRTELRIAPPEDEPPEAA